jgi:hypothetical protein
MASPLHSACREAPVLRIASPMAPWHRARGAAAQGTISPAVADPHGSREAALGLLAGTRGSNCASRALQGAEDRNAQATAAAPRALYSARALYRHTRRRDCGRLTGEGCGSLVCRSRGRHLLPPSGGPARDKQAANAGADSSSADFITITAESDFRYRQVSKMTCGGNGPAKDQLRHAVEARFRRPPVGHVL